MKFVRSLERASVRRREGVYLAEGVRLIDEAINTGQRASVVLYDSESLVRTPEGQALLMRLPVWAERGYEVDRHVLTAAAQTETPAGVVAVLHMTDPAPLSVQVTARFGLLLDGVSDPGNAGTILRTAAAAGVDFVVAMAATADLFAPKVVRAGMGAHFRLPVYSHMSIGAVHAALPGFSAVALEASGPSLLFSFQWPDRTLLVVGSEAHGLSPETQDIVVHRVRIPMKQGVESLNAAVAASIAVYQAIGPTIS